MATLPLADSFSVSDGFTAGGISFDPANKYILITQPVKSVAALDIYSEAMDWCDELVAIQNDPPMRAVGKAPLGGGTFTDSIFILQNGWKIKFWSGTYQALITGTVITNDETVRTVSPDSGSVEIVFQVSSQATVIQDDDIDAIKLKTDLLPSDPADQSLIEAHVTSEVASVKAKTDLLPADPADQSLVEAKITSEVDDLITRSKGLDDTHDDLDTHDTSTKGSGWTDETLKAIKDKMDVVHSPLITKGRYLQSLIDEG